MSQHQILEKDSEQVVSISIKDIEDFPSHPFKIIDNYEFLELMDSIKENGILSPAIVRPKNDDKYEMISGHRRKRASELLKLDTIPCIVKNLSDEEATVIMVDSNIQREKILPSEKAFAYKLKLDSLKKQGNELI